MITKIVSKLRNGGSITKDLPRHRIGFYGLIIAATTVMVVLAVF